MAQWLEDQGGFPLFTVEGESLRLSYWSSTLPVKQPESCSGSTHSQSSPVDFPGEEPEDAKHSWDLPSSFNASGKAAQGAADVAKQLGDRQDDSGANIGSFASPASR